MPRFDDGMASTVEPISVMAESLVNEIMDARADEACENGNRRNGHRERKLVSSIDTIDLRIPKLRAGNYFPEDPIERYSRVDRAVIAAVPEMVNNGVSTRKVKRVAQARASTGAFWGSTPSTPSPTTAGSRSCCRCAHAGSTA